MSSPDPAVGGARAGARPALVAVVVLLAAAIIYLQLGRGEPASERGSASPGAAESDAHLPLPDAAGDGDLVLRSGETVALDFAALPAGRPAELDLVLGEPSADREPRPARLFFLDGAGEPAIETHAEVRGESREVAQLRIDPGSLRPGRWLIEIETTERSHRPLRRYILELR